MATWQLQDAKAHFSEVVREAADEGPQNITVRGKPTAVVISMKDYKCMVARKPSFVEFMRKSPLVGLDLDLSRDSDLGRDIDL